MIVKDGGTEGAIAIARRGPEEHAAVNSAILTTRVRSSWPMYARGKHRKAILPRDGGPGITRLARTSHGPTLKGL